MWKRVLLLACVALCARTESLEERIEAVLEGSPEARQAFWGIHIVDTGSGEVLYSRNENRFFVPASNTKLFTTALALTRLGPEYRFQTRLEADRVADGEGTVGELRLIGGGDPNLSSRILPSGKNEFGENRMAPIDGLADAVVARGIKRISGDIVGDDTRYEWEPYPDGWSVDDPKWEYGAAVSALTFNDGTFTIRAAPGLTVGDPVRIVVAPPVEHLTIHNRTTTVLEADAKLTFERPAGSDELTVAGSLSRGARPREVLLAAEDPALFAAEALRTALLARGVEVQGKARAVHRLPGEDAVASTGVEIATRESAPLPQILQVINKVSQNLHAEIVLREVAHAKYGVGSRAKGLEEMVEYLRSVGVEDKQYNFEDGSGLSRLTLVTPLTIAKVLVTMYSSPLRDTWVATLPVGGVDGTLRTRFAAAPEAANIRAKTGSISHVSSLSGYALRADGKSYAFAVLANNYNSEHASVRKVIDRIALALLD